MELEGRQHKEGSHIIEIMPGLKTSIETGVFKKRRELDESERRRVKLERREVSDHRDEQREHKKHRKKERETSEQALEIEDKDVQIEIERKDIEKVAGIDNEIEKTKENQNAVQQLEDATHKGENEEETSTENTEKDSKTTDCHDVTDKQEGSDMEKEKEKEKEKEREKEKEEAKEKEKEKEKENERVREKENEQVREKEQQAETVRIPIERRIVYFGNSEIFEHGIPADNITLMTVPKTVVYHGGPLPEVRISQHQLIQSELSGGDLSQTSGSFLQINKPKKMSLVAWGYFFLSCFIPIIGCIVVLTTKRKLYRWVAIGGMLSALVLSLCIYAVKFTS